jgi:hypothetical protein
MYSVREAVSASYHKREQSRLQKGFAVFVSLETALGGSRSINERLSA